ncbi:hypothetical protein ACLBWH_10575 [Sphingomonas sp. M6A6_1c]|jgi:hypothetical protein|uniref:hypothetical protein n=1 Tax=Sphingomonas sp. CD22 TaxID=3100214 RepID=UPI001218DF76|nr:hypothetical protein [Sphingomonas sp. CD22]MEA1085502.1 hypothetical protein [Sphingomonas sp. CD22]RZL28105.1 MAG: hypothetical protein EOP64_05560 [Sphingomonas sp.]
MATIPDTSDDDIRRLNRDSAKLEAETRKLMAEAGKRTAEEYKLLAERLKLERDRMISPWLLLAQGLVAGAALVGAGAALAKMLIG